VSNPVHTAECDPRIAWTTGNMAEAMPGVSTPLNWAFFSQYDHAIHAAFAELGVYTAAEVNRPRRVEECFVGIFYGRSAANLDQMRALADRIPGVSPDEVEEQLMGAVRPGVTSTPIRRRYPAILTRMPVVVTRLPARCRNGRQESFRWWRDVVDRADRLTYDDALTLLVEAIPRFHAASISHCLVSFLATPKYRSVVGLAAEAGHPELAGKLLTATGEVEEAAIASDLWEVSRDRLSLDEFLRRHGYHGPGEGQIDKAPWREAPRSLDRVLESYRAMPEELGPTASAERNRVEREHAWEVCVRSASRRDRIRRSRAVRGASAYLGLREQGKASFLMVLDVGRIAARIVGRELTRKGVFGDPDDIFFLTAEELTHGPELVPASTIADRRATHEAYLAQGIPQQWSGIPIPYPLAGREELATSDTIEGLGVSPGVQEATARLCLQPDDCELEPGEILVCATTDPSYAVLLGMTSGIVIDIGGPLSHGAIVARELGVPCVINTGDGTSRIKTGDRLRIDGTTGRVTILPPA
jgi:pyruvate,water dikinase